jgi:hypothetical protein
MGMKRQVTVIVALALASFVGVARAEDKPNPAGTWKWTATFGNNKVDLTLKLKLDKDKLTGTITGRDGKEAEIEEPKYKDGEVTFTVTRERNGTKIPSKYSGKVSGDTLKGKIESERNGKATSRDWEATRAKD